MLNKLLYTLLFLTFPVCAAQAQAVQPAPAAKAADSAQSRSRLSSHEEEMLKRSEIRRSEESHKEMLERADETAQLGDEVLSSFDKGKSLSRDDLKKLERMEKLARKIRSGAGGSDNDEELKEPPPHLGAAVPRLAEVSELLNKNVRKTSRLVISAAVIEQSNELIQLIRLIRNFGPQ